MSLRTRGPEKGCMAGLAETQKTHQWCRSLSLINSSVWYSRLWCPPPTGFPHCHKMPAAAWRQDTVVPLSSGISLRVKQDLLAAPIRSYLPSLGETWIIVHPQIDNADEVVFRPRDCTQFFPDLVHQSCKMAAERHQASMNKDDVGGKNDVGNRYRKQTMSVIQAHCKRNQTKQNKKSDSSINHLWFFSPKVATLAVFCVCILPIKKKSSLSMYINAIINTDLYFSKNWVQSDL